MDMEWMEQDVPQGMVNGDISGVLASVDARLGDFILIECLGYGRLNGSDRLMARFTWNLFSCRKPSFIKTIVMDESRMDSWCHRDKSIAAIALDF